LPAAEYFALMTTDARKARSESTLLSIHISIIALLAGLVPLALQAPEPRLPEFTIIQIQSHQSQGVAFDSRIEVNYQLAPMWEHRDFSPTIKALLKEQGLTAEANPAKEWMGSYLAGGNPTEFFRRRGSIIAMKPGERLQFYAARCEGGAKDNDGSVATMTTVRDGVFRTDVRTRDGKTHTSENLDKNRGISNNATVQAEIIRTPNGAVLWFQNSGVPGAAYADYLGAVTLGANLVPSSAQWRSVFTFTLNNQELAAWDQINRTNQALLVDTADNGTTLNYKAELRIDQPGDEVEVTIEPEDGYEKWIPEGNLNQVGEAGNKLKVHLRVHKKGDPATLHRAKLEITLKNTSMEKGVCLNWPVQGAKADNGLKLLQKENPDLEVLRPDQARTKDFVEETDVVVTSHDFGAYGVLQVSGKDSKEQDIKVTVRGKDTPDLDIPFDENHNHIADAWEKQWAGGLKGQETDDEDSVPVGDGHTGDALSLYEEYRGFRISAGAETTPSGGTPQELIKGAHVRTNPGVKDVFICDTLGMGIGSFGVSGLQVHLVKPEETGGSRSGAFNPHIINPNREKYSLGEQYVLWIESGAGKLDADTLGIAIMKVGPGVPRDCLHILVASPDTGAGTTISRLPTEDDRVNITHELAHACNVKHHGDTDAVEIVKVQSLEIDPENPNAAPKPKGEAKNSNGSTWLLVNEAGGTQSSGDVHCYMIYVPTFVEDPQGDLYLWNAKGKQYRGRNINRNSTKYKQYRFCDKPSTWELGPAGPPEAGRGDCLHQFCVNHLKH
jgi:hypothetical protein